MEKKQKYSRAYFIIGLLVGLLIGLYFNFRNKTTETTETYTPLYITQSDDTKTDVKKPIKKKRKKKIKITQDSLEIDSMHTNIDSLINDSLINDTLLGDTLINNIDSINILGDSLEYRILQIEPSNDDDIQLSKDELIYAMYAYPEGAKSDFTCKSNGKLDSVLVNNTTKRTDNGIYIEFWHSPINYSGYKLGFNTLILYGFYEYTSINLKYMNNGQLLLKYKGHKYILKCTDEFINLELIKE